MLRVPCVATETKAVTLALACLSLRSHVVDSLNALYLVQTRARLVFSVSATLHLLGTVLVSGREEQRAPKITPWFVFYPPSQLSESKTESEELLRQCAGGVAARVERLVGALQQAGREQVGARHTRALCEKRTAFFLRTGTSVPRMNHLCSEVFSFFQRCRTLLQCLDGGAKASFGS